MKCEQNCCCEFPESEAVTCELCQEPNCGGKDCNIPNWRGMDWNVCTACDGDKDKVIERLLDEIQKLQEENRSLRNSF